MIRTVCSWLRTVIPRFNVWKDHPTADYIAKYANAYADANLTTWEAAGKTHISIAHHQRLTSFVQVTRSPRID